MTIPIYSVITILICHFIFDFFFQSNEMAQNKSKCNYALSSHVYVYTLGIFLMAVLNAQYLTALDGFIFVGVNAMAHWFTDYFSSRASSRLWKDGEVHDFFGTIGLDQLVHYLTLFGTFVWLTH